MRFGIFGGPIRGGAPDDAKVYQDFVDEMVAAESLGFDGVYLVEHHFTGIGQVSSSLTLLAHLAARTERLRLGTAVVVVPWHNPLLLAEQAASVDVLSRGRLDLGLGRGYRDSEFRGFGVDPGEAESRFEETLEVLRRAWTSQGRFSHCGRHWSFDDVVIEPRPVQTPHPPLWTGAGSPKSIARAASRGLRLLLDQVGSFELTASRLACYRAAVEAEGRQFEPSHVAVTRGLRIARSESERECQLRIHLATLRFLSDAAEPPKASGLSHPFYSDPATRRQAAEQSAILGTPEECVRRLRTLESAGVEQVLFSGATLADLRFFAREVMPAFS